MEIKKHLTYDDFKINYENDFKKWLEDYPSGVELEFLYFIKEKYKEDYDFFVKLDGTAFVPNIQLFRSRSEHDESEVNYTEFETIIERRFIKILRDKGVNYKEQSIEYLKQYFGFLFPFLISTSIAFEDSHYMDNCIYRYADFIELKEINETISLKFNYKSYENYYFTIKRIVDFVDEKVAALTQGTNVKKELSVKTKLFDTINADSISDSASFFNFVFDNDISDFTTTKTLQRLTHNYEEDLLISLFNDLDFYIAQKKEDLECSFTSDDILEAVNERKKNNLEIPYIKITPFNELTEKGKESRLKTGDLKEHLIDKEALLFPYDLYPLYRLKNKVVSKLKELKRNKSNDTTIQIESDVVELPVSNAIQKIIYLSELGVIDFLKSKQPFVSSTNSLATVLSTILGEKITTIQPYLNALSNNSIESNKHPYYSKTSVEKVKKQLINIGFTAE